MFFCGPQLQYFDRLRCPKFPPAALAEGFVVDYCGPLLFKNLHLTEPVAPMFGRKIMIALIAMLASVSARGDGLKIAVASNFAEPLREIARLFGEQSGHQASIHVASSGHLYAQIVNGAPYDVFLSADLRRPERLEQESLVVPGSRFTYAIGQLLVWSRDPRLAGKSCVDSLRHLGKSKLAIANPQLAPYGAAAKQYLEKYGLWKTVQPNLVLGQNIAQTFQYAATGNAQVAMISTSQRAASKDFQATCAEAISALDHDAIRQQAVQLENASNPELATRFLDFLRGSESHAIISAYGYLLPAGM